VLAAIDAGGHDGRADRHWILDPIDGTVGFLKGGACQYTGEAPAARPRASLPTAYCG